MFYYCVIVTPVTVIIRIFLLVSIATNFLSLYLIYFIYKLFLMPFLKQTRVFLYRLTKQKADFPEYFITFLSISLYQGAIQLNNKRRPISDDINT